VEIELDDRAAGGHAETEALLAPSPEGTGRWPLEGYDRVPRPMRVDPAPYSLRILFLYSRPPLPMARGDEATVAHLLEFLHARGHTVDFLTLVPKGHRWRAEHLAWLESRCRRVETIPLGVAESMKEGVRGLARGWPFQIGYLLSRRQLARAAELAVTQDYDLAYAYYVRSAEALLATRRSRAHKTYLALQLSQTLNTRRLARTAATLRERLFYRFEQHRMAAYEARIWQKVDGVVLIGPSDLEAIRAACAAEGQPPIDNHIWGPHGVDTARFAPRRRSLEEPGTVLMSGVMRYAPNVEAARWFVAEVWPEIRKCRPAARFILVGRDPTPAIQSLHGRDGITVTGTVDEPADWIARAEVCVAPIRAAAGLQNKILEAMAMAKAVVATPEANEGIAATADRDLLVADGARAFADAVLGLLDDAERRAALGDRARDFVEAEWTWEGPFLKLEAAFLAGAGDAAEHAARPEVAMARPSRETEEPVV
jgi:polysaccharide biosynthesis protein PslH